MRTGPQPRSTAHIHAKRQFYCSDWRPRVTLTIDVCEALSTNTWNMPSYLGPHPPSCSHRDTHTANNVRQALLSCDRAWNTETTTEHFEPGFTIAFSFPLLFLDWTLSKQTCVWVIPVSPSAVPFPFRVMFVYIESTPDDTVTFNQGVNHS